MIQEIDRNGEVVWEFELADNLHRAHHDVEPMPNGNTLIAIGVGGRILEIGAGYWVVWEYVNPYTEDERPRAKRADPDADPGTAADSIYRATRISPDHPRLARLGGF